MGLQSQVIQNKFSTISKVSRSNTPTGQTLPYTNFLVNLPFYLNI